MQKNNKTKSTKDIKIYVFNSVPICEVVAKSFTTDFKRVQNNYKVLSILVLGFLHTGFSGISKFEKTNTKNTNYIYI